MPAPKKAQYKPSLPKRKASKFLQQVRTLRKKRTWNNGYDPLLVECVQAALAESNFRLWPRIKRIPCAYSNFASLNLTELRNKYHTLAVQDETDNLCNSSLVPMFKSQRTSHLPQEHLPLTSVTAIQPPMYGPRFGFCESDDDDDQLQLPLIVPSSTLDRPLFQLPDSSIVHNSPDHPASSLAPHDDAAAEAVIPVPESIHLRIQNTAVAALRSKLTSLDYQASVLFARMAHKQAHPDAPTSDPTLLPPAQFLQLGPDGMRYFDNLPTPPTDPTTRSFLPKNLSLPHFDLVLPSVAVEYAFIYDQCEYYYLRRDQPLSLHWFGSLYPVDQQLACAQLLAPRQLDNLSGPLEQSGLPAEEYGIIAPIFPEQIEAAAASQSAARNAAAIAAAATAAAAPSTRSSVQQPQPTIASASESAAMDDDALTTAATTTTTTTTANTSDFTPAHLSNTQLESLLPQYSPRLTTFKTFLNCVLGFPIWYSIVFANFMYSLYESSILSEKMLPPRAQQEVHSYARRVFGFVLMEYYSKFPTSFSPAVEATSPKEAYQTLFMGGGRYALIGAEMTSNQEIPPAVAPVDNQ